MNESPGSCGKWVFRAKCGVMAEELHITRISLRKILALKSFQVNVGDKDLDTLFFKHTFLANLYGISLNSNQGNLIAISVFYAGYPSVVTFFFSDQN